MSIVLNVLSAICLLVGVFGCTETILMLAAVPANKTAAWYELAVADVWWAGMVAIGGFAIGLLGLCLAHRFTKPRRTIQGVQ